MESNQTTRVLDLLKRFNNNEKVCIDRILEEAKIDADDNIPNIWLNSKNKPVSDKTIRRVLDVLKPYFNFELLRGGKGEKGCYKAITKEVFNNFLDQDMFSLMIQTFNIANKSNLFDNFEFNTNDKKILESKIKETNHIYEFISKPLETKKQDKIILSKCEKAIKDQNCIIIEYNNNKFEVKPYKIIFINENFYLGCEIEHEKLEFAMYRISKIKTVEPTNKTFQSTPEIHDFIKNIQSPFPFFRQNYKERLVPVVLHVAKDKANFFIDKKFFPSQTEKKQEDGSLLVTYQLTQEMEIESFIKSWIPFVKVISPISLTNKIEDELKTYLS